MVQRRSLPPVQALRRSIGVFFVALSVVGCRTTSTSGPSNLSSAVIVRAMPQEAWQVKDGERVIGFVVRFETTGESDRAYFSVRNEHQQELGIVDAETRVWRYRAHQREPDWLGSGTVESGARSILGGSAGTQLVPIALDRLSAGVTTR
jgi:hypothetical protein